MSMRTFAAAGLGAAAVVAILAAPAPDFAVTTDHLSTDTSDVHVPADNHLTHVRNHVSPRDPSVAIPGFFEVGVNSTP